MTLERVSVDRVPSLIAAFSVVANPMQLRQVGVPKSSRLKEKVDSLLSFPL